MICQQCGKGAWACNCYMDREAINHHSQEVRKLVGPGSAFFQEQMQSFKDRQERIERIFSAIREARIIPEMKWREEVLTDFLTSGAMLNEITQAIQCGEWRIR